MPSLLLLFANTQGGVIVLGANIRARYMDYYNNRSYHQGIDLQIPAARYAAANRGLKSNTEV